MRSKKQAIELLDLVNDPRPIEGPIRPEDHGLSPDDFEPGVQDGPNICFKAKRKPGDLFSSCDFHVGHPDILDFLGYKK